jgi:hypothetical protein
MRAYFGMHAFFLFENCAKICVGVMIMRIAYEVLAEELSKEKYRDGKTDVAPFLKECLMHAVNQLEIKESKEKVRLFHGTTTFFLNDILTEGLKPRLVTGNDNWQHASSNETAVYLTNKWHYFYAYQVRNHRAKDTDLWWEDWQNLPCYVECSISKSRLVPDEDFIHSVYINQKFRKAMKRKQDLEITWEESLAHYGTVGVLGDIKKSDFISFSILGERALFNELFLDPASRYRKDLLSWSTGKGKGSVKLMELIERESESALNGTWMMDQIPKDAKINQVGLNQRGDNLALSFAKNS